MGQVIGPFDVQDARDAGQLAAVQDVAAAIPPAMAAADGQGRQKLWFYNRLGAPAYAWGYTPNGRNEYVSPSSQSPDVSLPDQLRHVAGHEYWHGWQRRHPAAANALMARYVPRPWGNKQTAHWTDSPHEAMADAFTRALGFSRGVRPSYYRVRVPDASLAGLAADLGKVEARPVRASHQLLLSGPVALRESPQLQAPVAAWAVAGSAIRAVLGLSGGPYVIRLADGTGLRSPLWLQVDALDGRPLVPPLWTAALLWAPLPAMPPAAPPSTASSP